ncbi:MAG: GYD domain-containing protein [Chloroflexi bacterium]|nr:GYD domain-containing protein [Chloroflexota bacterium]
MPTYVVLYKFTDQGLKSIKDTVKRAREVRAENERRGFKVIGTYWTQGRYDIVSIVDAPSEDAMLAGLFNIAATGNVHSQTLRAYTDAEMEKALQAG